MGDDDRVDVHHAGRDVSISVLSGDGGGRHSDGGRRLRVVADRRVGCFGVCGAGRGISSLVARAIQRADDGAHPCRHLRREEDPGAPSGIRCGRGCVARIDVALRLPSDRQHSSMVDVAGGVRPRRGDAAGRHARRHCVSGGQPVGIVRTRTGLPDGAAGLLVDGAETATTGVALWHRVSLSYCRRQPTHCTPPVVPRCA